ncbi:hypothetical protein BC940DRAFT_338276 [Gongronella butleri]|nr:hypothetical protein BC940DRAFT_338276 [Gongronella butleri]
MVMGVPIRHDQAVFDAPAPDTGAQNVDLKPYVLSSTHINSYMLSNSLTDYYEAIVDQVMETSIGDIISSAPHSYMLFYPDHVSGCQASVCPFIHALGDHLNLMKSNLVASVRPLVDAHLPTLPLKMMPATNEAKTVDVVQVANQLSEAMNILNQRMALHLGLIINANEAAEIIIRQSVPLTNSEHTSDASEYADTHKTATKATKAMTEWLHLWLSEIEGVFYSQFDERIQDVIQSILEDFLVEE